MNYFRMLLWPFSLLYASSMGIRNWLYSKGWLVSYSYSFPVIAVGNLSVGGTGKTPHIEYLIRLLSIKYQLATLSRGYKRKSKGFRLGTAQSTAAILGDEPYQLYRKFGNTISVAVDTNRHHGILELQKEVQPQVILLDDAFQHRRVTAGLYILLTDYAALYTQDWVLPAGNLRECAAGAQRANVVIVTKCPLTITQKEQKEIAQKLKLHQQQQLYFSAIGYADYLENELQKIPLSYLKNESYLAIAGIAKPQPFFDFLGQTTDDCMVFPDHHFFTTQDIERIKKRAAGRKIITTEKDFVRLSSFFEAETLWYLPISSILLDNEEAFQEKIISFVTSNL